jgi:hypothetical protein
MDLPVATALKDHIAAVLAPYDSFKWMGCVICAVAMFGVAPIYFPMWGGLICGPKKGVTEEDYYFSEYTPAEREAGHHLASSKFVSHFLLLLSKYSLRYTPCYFCQFTNKL